MACARALRPRSREETEMKERLIDAVKAGDVVTVRELLDKEPALANARTETGDSAILLAVYYARKEVAEILVAKGAELNVFEASAMGATERLKAFLKVDGGPVNSHSHDGWTPLHLAAFFGHGEAAKVLVANGAELNALSKNATCNTPLHAAVANRKADLVSFLLSAGADVNARTGNGWMPLHLAVHGGNKQLAELLLAQGADVSAENGDGQTALAIALEKGHKELAELLRQYGEHIRRW